MRSTRNARGVTLVELLIVVVMLAAAFGFFGAVAHGCTGCDDGGSSAVAEAQGYLGALYPGVSWRAVCQDVDTNNDGYVSCTAVPGGTPPPGVVPPVALECASRWSRNTSCRLAPRR